MYSKYKIHFLPWSGTLYLSKLSLSVLWLHNKSTVMCFRNLPCCFLPLWLSTYCSLLLGCHPLSSWPASCMSIHSLRSNYNSLLCGQSIATPHPHLRHLSRARHTLLCAISVFSMTITFIYITSLCMPFLYFQCLRYYAQIWVKEKNWQIFFKVKI